MNDMNITLPLDAILSDLSGLSNSNKRWLADRLYEQIEPVNIVHDKETEKFLNELLAMPSNYDLTADDHMEMVRASRQSGITRNVEVAL